MALWVVRAGRHGEREEFALENNVVIIGWGELPDLVGSFDSREALHTHMRQIYPDRRERGLANWTGQIRAFANNIQVGDVVVLPRRGMFAFGRVTEPYHHVPDAPEDARHQLPVEWLERDFPRGRVDADLRYSLYAPMTVFRVKRNDAEARIRVMLRIDPRPGDVGKEATDREDHEAEADFDPAAAANDQIIESIGRKFRGHDLPRLVAAILRAQGFETRVSPPGPDGGVDILAGGGFMGFGPPRLCVQVKSGDGPVGVNVLRELQGVMANYGAEQGLIVAWGGFRESVKREARQRYFQIRLWDQLDLVEAVQDVYDRFDVQLQAELPLKRIWMLSRDEEGEG